MGTKRLKQYLTLLLAIGVIAVVASGSGTFASFSAETTNANNTFQNGTLYLHNSDGVTTCTSESQTTTPSFNYKEDCYALFSSETLSNAVVQKVLTLTNAGTIPASDIKFAVANCQVTTTDAAPNPPFVTLGTGTNEFGCNKVDLAIQEVDAASLSGTAVYCAYGNAATSCTLGSGTTLASSETAGLTNLKTAGPTDADLPDTSSSPANSRYYIVKIQPDLTNFGDANALQDVKLTFDLKWHIDQ